MEIQVKQNSFIAGYITKEALERSDKPEYYHGASELFDVQVQAQGGIRRRPGTRYVGEVPAMCEPLATGVVVVTPNGGDGNKLLDGNLDEYFKTLTAIGATDGYVAFEVNFLESTYLDYFDLNNVSIDNGQNKTPLLSDQFEIQYTVDGDVWQTAKRIVVSNNNDDSYRAPIHQSVWRIRVIRVGSQNLAGYYFWAATIKFWRQTQDQGIFSTSTLIYSYSQNYLLIFTEGTCTVYRNETAISVMPTPLIKPSQLKQLKFSTFGESLIVTHQDVPPLLIQRYGSDDLWRIFPIVFGFVPRYDANVQKENLSGSFGVTESAGVTTVTGSTSAFFPEDVSSMVYGNGGSGRIISYTSATSVIISVVNKFSFMGGTQRPGWTIDRSAKPLWGPEYGYPECSGFFANRLWLGGFKRTPRTIAGSVIGDFLNFDTGDLEDDDALIVSLANGSTHHNIRHIFSFDNLEIFSELGVFALKKFDAGGLTELATAFYFRKPIGIEPYIAPFRVEDGGTLFVKNGRADIRELTYDDVTYTYNAKSRTIWSTDAIRGIQSVCVVRSSEADVASMVYVVNGQGNLACITFLLSDGVHAAAIWRTQGTFKACESTLQDAYVIVERGGRLFIERVTSGAYLDSERSYADCTGGTLEGLEHLAGKTVQVRADLEYLGEFQVSDDGKITIPSGQWAMVHVGLGFTSSVVPMPPENPQQTYMGKWVSYDNAYISVFDTQGILVDGYEPEFIGRTFSAPNLTPLTLKEGRYRIPLGNAPDLLPKLKITQDKPLVFNIRSIAYTAEVS